MVSTVSSPRLRSLVARCALRARRRVGGGGGPQCSWLEKIGTPAYIYIYICISFLPGEWKRKGKSKKAKSKKAKRGANSGEVLSHVCGKVATSCRSHRSESPSDSMFSPGFNEMSTKPRVPTMVSQRCEWNLQICRVAHLRVPAN